MGNEKWRKAMIEKFGSEEALKDYMRSLRAKSKGNAAGVGGFGDRDPDEAFKQRQKGGRNGRRSR